MKAETPILHTRIFIALSDLAILSALNNQAMTGYGLYHYFLKKIGDVVSLSTIYSTLETMKRKGLIKSVVVRRGRVYDLTDKGREIVDNVDNTVGEIKRFIDKLLKP